jgi:hypothetical protein
MTTEKAQENTQAATRDLWRVAEADDIDQVKSILARGADINGSDAHGMTAIMRAAVHGQIRMVRLLLKHGADPNKPRNDKFTPLMLAAFFGHQEIVRILVEHGADTDATTRFGTSAQMWASARTFKDVAHYLEDPHASRRSSKVTTVKDTGLGGGTAQETLNGYRNLNFRRPTIALEKASRLAELGSAKLVSDDQSSNDLPDVQETLPHFAQRPRFFSGVPPLNRSIGVYALTTLLLFLAVFAHLALDRQQRLREVTSQRYPTVTINSSAIVVKPSASDGLSDVGEAKVVAPSDTQTGFGNNLTTHYKMPNKLKPPLATSGVVSADDSFGRRNPSEKQNGVISVSQPRPIPVRTPEEARSTELSAAASTAKSQPAVSHDPVPTKRRAPLGTQLITGSKSSPLNGKVIQWPLGPD